MERKSAETMITLPPQSDTHSKRLDSGVYSSEAANSAYPVDPEKISFILHAFQTRTGSAIDTFLEYASTIIPVQRAIVHENGALLTFKNPGEDPIITQNKDDSLSFFAPFCDRTIELRCSNISAGELIAIYKSTFKILIKIAAREHELETQKGIDTRNFMALVHDVRNKISAVVYLSQNLDDEGIDERDRKISLRYIQESVLGAAKLLDHSVMLYVEKADGLKLRTMPTNVKELLRKMVADFQSRLKVTYRAPTKIITVDPVHLERVLQNLIENAIKFSNEHAEGVRVDVCEENNELVIEIKDRGNGIGEDPDRLFGFFQHGKAKHGKEGLGIGLGYCKMICEKMGGSISGKNNAGECGSTFTIKLPISDKSGRP